MMQQEPRKAALGVLLGGERVEGSDNHVQPQADGGDVIAMLRPWELESKHALRRKLNNCALLAANRAERAGSPHSRQLFWLVAQVAGEWVLAAADEEALDDIRRALVFSTLAADAFERNGSGS